MTDKEKIDQYIGKLPDWQKDYLTRIREIVLSTNSEITEEWKWNCPVWKMKKPICASSGFKKHVKLNFFNGALFEVDKSYFNSGFESKKSRSINLEEGQEIDKSAIQYLVKSAIEFENK